MPSISHSLAIAATLLFRSTASAASSSKETAATDVTAPSTPLLTVTVVKEALTTTFTPPASCSSSRLTQLAPPGYQIWLHEPMPADDTLFDDCYPPEFASAYTSVANASSSVAPLMSPLVCPVGWHTAQTWDGGYIACCADGYLLHPPDEGKLADPGRPAYGGTCYSDFGVGKTVTVTKWDNVKPTATGEWVATNSLDQAYGHVIDGFALDLISNSKTIPPETSSPSPDHSSDESDGLSGGAIAGIVIGSLAGLALIFVGAFLLIRRRSARPQTHIDGNDNQTTGQTRLSNDIYKAPTGFYTSESGNGHGSVRSMNSATASPPMTAISSPVSELGGRTRYELGSTTYAELESTHNRHEVC
jgi:hypothetical protein